ncbi:MAG: hypothetical protein ACLVJ6_15980 [Merdibacter sp.]
MKRKENTYGDRKDEADQHQCRRISDDVLLKFVDLDYFHPEPAVDSSIPCMV